MLSNATVNVSGLSQSEGLGQAFPHVWNEPPHGRANSAREGDPAQSGHRARTAACFQLAVGSGAWVQCPASPSAFPSLPATKLSMSFRV